MTETNAPAPDRWNEALKWLAFADSDIRVAEYLRDDPNLALAAAFHCQQAAEKMAKAVLVAFHGAYPRIHDIGELGRRIGDLRSDIGDAIENLGGLTRWYSESRYPGFVARYYPTLEDVRAALAALKDLRRCIDDLAPKA
jgi:HEPN domain-containing protein